MFCISIFSSPPVCSVVERMKGRNCAQMGLLSICSLRYWQGVTSKATRVFEVELRGRHLQGFFLFFSLPCVKYCSTLWHLTPRQTTRSVVANVTGSRRSQNPHIQRRGEAKRGENTGESDSSITGWGRELLIKYVLSLQLGANIEIDLIYRHPVDELTAMSPATFCYRELSFSLQKLCDKHCR